MVDFVCAEYRQGQTVANNELRKRIARYGLKRIARETGIDRNILRLIARGKPVKPKTLAQVVGFVEKTALTVRPVHGAAIVGVVRDENRGATGVPHSNPGD